MLEIIYGTAGSDRDEIAYGKIGEAIRKGEVCYILVPEQFSLSAEKYIIKRFGISAQTHAKVITFSRLCNLVLSKMGPLRMKYIDGAGKQILAARTIRNLHGRLTALAPSLRRKGFSATVVELISEMKRYGVLAEQLVCAADEIGESELSDKLRDISALSELFNSYLEGQAADAEDNLELILPRLKDCGFLSGNLYMMHFRSFTPVEYKVIAQLMLKMNVCAAMCCDGVYDGSTLFSPISATCRTLAEEAETNGVEVSIYAAQKNREQNELLYLADSYFKSNPKQYSGKAERVKIFEVSNTYREVEAAADLILRLCREEGRKFSDFLVLARDTESYNRIMPAIFAARGIDVFLDTRRSILTKSLCETVCACLDILAFGYSYDRVMEIARSGIMNVPEEDVDLFENYLLAVSPSHAMWAEEEWTYCPDGYDIEVINRTRHGLLDFVRQINDAFEGRKTAGQICEVLSSVLFSEERAEHMQKLCDSFAENGMPYLADEYRQVWDSTVSVLAQISALMDEENITWKDFGELFKNACGGISVGLTPQTQGSVTFSRIDRFRTDGVPVVIVLGMNEGVFPASHTAEGILSDAERMRLSELGIQLAPGADAKRREEQLLIYSVLTAATEKLCLFVPIADIDGKQLEMSPIIKKIRTKIFADTETVNPDLSGDFLRLAEGRRAAFDVLCSALAEAEGDPEKLCEAGQTLYGYFKDVPDYADSLEDIEENMRVSAPEKLSKDAVRAIYGDMVMLSASKLEKYNACAFSYFMNYGLLAAERDRAGIEPRSTGSIQHAALYEYFSELKAAEVDYSQITIDDCYKRIYSIVKDEALKSTELLYESSSYYKYVVTRMQGIAARTAWEVVKFYKSSKFRPMGFEIRIDTGGEIPALEIKDDEGRKIARLRGIIDRADSAVINGKTYISVIDYKSSQKNLDERLAAAGVNLQPLLYSDIVCRRLSASPAAMLYMQMTDPIVDEAKLKGVTFGEIERAVNGKISLGGWLSDTAEVVSGYSLGGENGEKYIPSGKTSLVSEEELKRRIEAANQKIRESAMGIYDGNIAAEPYADKGFDACQYCMYSSSCRQ